MASSAKSGERCEGEMKERSTGRLLRCAREESSSFPSVRTSSRLIICLLRFSARFLCDVGSFSLFNFFEGIEAMVGAREERDDRESERDEQRRRSEEEERAWGSVEVLRFF